MMVGANIIGNFKRNKLSEKVEIYRDPTNQELFDNLYEGFTGEASGQYKPQILRKGIESRYQERLKQYNQPIVNPFYKKFGKDLGTYIQQQVHKSNLQQTSDLSYKAKPGRPHGDPKLQQAYTSLGTTSIRGRKKKKIKKVKPHNY